MSNGVNGSYRRASHAGSWYVSDSRELDTELTSWLREAKSQQPPAPRAKAVIAPHAGYRYSGPCAGHAYSQIDPSGIKRVFILGPSHHVHLPGCAVSACSKYETPLYDLEVDTELSGSLAASGDFEVMSLETDEDEHSIEMHLPYVAKVMEARRGRFKVVPILVGALTVEKEVEYGRKLARHLADPENVFVVSSDFCHWGSRFRYTHYDEKCGEIHESIKELDFKGMNLIEALDHKGFAEYLKKYRNTICGRHPIGVLLAAIDTLKEQQQAGMRMKFLNYAQSSKCKSMRDSSVSYAAASFVLQ